MKVPPAGLIFAFFDSFIFGFAELAAGAGAARHSRCAELYEIIRTQFREHGAAAAAYQPPRYF